MASSILSSPLFLVNPNPNHIKQSLTSRRRVLVLAKQDSQDPYPSLIRVGSSIRLQKVVFEDQSRGIVCYLDDQGEMTCEGYDEGPRLHPDVSRFSCHQRSKEDFVHLLEMGLLQVTDGGKVN